jgi:hypothetical protein
VQANPRYRQLCEDNVSMARELAIKTGAVNVPFSFDSIKNTHWWIDDCHLNPEGEKNKAQIVLPFVISAALKKSHMP